MNDETGKFHFKWLSKNSFVISLNFSVGTNLIVDTNHPNTKSDIIYYGELLELKNSKTEIVLKTKKKVFLPFLMIALPVLVILFHAFIGMAFPVFMVALILFPVVIFGLLNVIKREEDRLLQIFTEFLDLRLNSKH